MYKKRKIVHVVACGNNNEIGIGNTLPWRCPEDLAEFKARTMNGVCLIGATTYLGLPSTLKGRELIVLSRHFKYSGKLAENVTIADCLAVALEKADYLIEEKGLKNDIFVIGGSEIYRLTERIVDEVHLSRIDIIVDNATHFYQPPKDVLIHEYRFKPR